MMNLRSKDIHRSNARVEPQKSTLQNIKIQAINL